MCRRRRLARGLFGPGNGQDLPGVGLDAAHRGSVSLQVREQHALAGRHLAVERAQCILLEPAAVPLDFQDFQRLGAR